MNMSIARSPAAAEHSGPGLAPKQSNGIHQIAHDIHHELSTITLLASLICASKDVGADTHRRAEQMLSEIAWLEELLGQMNDAGGRQMIATHDDTRVPLDDLVTAMVKTFRVAHSTRITADVVPAVAEVDRLALWRLLRNLMCNALDAAGPLGRVHIRVRPALRHVFVTIEDDGPGFGLTTSSGSSLGLDIVRGVLAAAGGRFSVSSGSLGGCRVRVALPGSSPALDTPTRDGRECV